MSDNEEVRVAVKSCPFCGELPKVSEWGDQIIKRASVKCDKCRCGFHDVAYAHAPNLLEGLLEKWNSRSDGSFEIVLPKRPSRWAE